MPAFSLTDSLGNPVGLSKTNITSASSLASYLKSELLHLAVAPDFIARKDETLSLAAPNSARFQITVGKDFQLGAGSPEVDITPEAHAELCVNTKPGSDVFDDDPFPLPAVVPPQAAYVGFAIAGSLDLGFSGSSGGLTFGIDRDGSVTFEYLKAFSTDRSEPTLGDATSSMFSSFVIPARLADLKLLGVNDICSVSGQGSLKVSGGVSITTPVNPLASVNLPLGAGAITVSDGAMTGLSASFTLSGSYQIRVQKMKDGVVRLSYVKRRGSALEFDLRASAGVTATYGKTELLAKLMGALEKGVPDPQLLVSLSPDELGSFNAVIKAGIDHSLRASVNAALSSEADTQTAFQYEVQIDQLNSQSSAAIESALKGDLTALTALEDGASPDGTIAPGVKLINSVLSTIRAKGVSLRVNLLGIVNLISMSKLISKCEFLFEPATGELTIHETAQSETISAITDPLNRQEALRKAMFYSVVATTAYVAGKTLAMPALSCEAVHFAVNQNTNARTIADYTNWFVALNLMTPDQRSKVVGEFAGGGPSSCTVRVQFDDELCTAMFFDVQGEPRPLAQYLEIGRQALKTLLDPESDDIDRGRYQFIDNPDTWTQAVAIGPSPELRRLIPLSSTDPKFNVLLADVTGDLYDIVWWADAMQKAGQAVHAMRAFLAGRDPASLANDPQFASRRIELQKLLLSMVGSSKLRFREPWGMVSLFQAAGGPRSSGRLTAKGLLIDQENGAPRTITAGGAGA